MTRKIWYIYWISLIAVVASGIGAEPFDAKKTETTAASRCGCARAKPCSYDTDLPSMEPIRLQQADHTTAKISTLHFPVGKPVLYQENLASQTLMEFSADQCNQFCDCAPNSSMPNGWTGRNSSIGRWEHCSPCTLLRWPLSGLPSDIIVTEATIKLYCHGRWGQISGHLLFAPVTEYWDSRVTYAKRPLIDASQAIEAEWPNAGQWFEIDITSIAEQWSKGTLSNYGIQVYTTSTARTGGIDIRTPGWTDPQYRPKLTIIYDYTSSTDEKNPYFGQEPPGLVPEVFAPGIISLENRYEQYAAFAPDGNEFCFSVTNAAWSLSMAFYVKREQGQWTEPKSADFIGSGDVWCPHFSPDGEGFYFVSSRPSNSPTNIWMCERTPNGWSAPVKLDSPVSSSRNEWGFSVIPDKSIYLCSHRPEGSGGCDIWYCQYVGGQYVSAENISILNTVSNDCAPYVPPDQSFLVFNSTRAGGYGTADLYISHRLEDGSWSTPINLGPTINTGGSEYAFSLSPDAKYGFFTRRSSNNSDIYWVDIRAIIPDPNGPVLNLTTEQRFASIQTAVNYAESGQIILLPPGEYKENIMLPAKELTIRSDNEHDSAIVSLTTISSDSELPVLTLLPGSTIKLLGLTICDGATGISCSEAQLEMSHCVVTGNQGCGVEVSDESHLEMSHCIVAGNAESGLHSLAKTVGRGESLYSHVDITNCTIVQNQQYAIDGNDITVVNSILYFNGESVDGVQIHGNNLNVIFSDVQGGFVGQGNIDANPEFVALGTWADPNVSFLGDYHLRSTAGRWDPIVSTWVLDETSSPCIDAGKPDESFSSETSGNGGIINMGAYGGTLEASRTTIDE